MFLRLGGSVYATSGEYAESLFKEAARYIDAAYEVQKDSAEIIATFLCGQAGVYALRAVIAHQNNMSAICSASVRQLFNMERDCLRERSSEILYGKAGYLYALQFVNANLPESVLPATADETINRVVQSILASGRAYSKQTHQKSPLMWRWHEEYLGAAHGLAGILYLLLQFPTFLSEDDLKDIDAAAQWLKSLALSDHNYPAHVDEERTDLVQWCHGAPGMVALFVRLHEVMGERGGYLAAAREAAEVVWTKGLLTKSVGLCHGTIGNAWGGRYAFLALWAGTGEAHYLHKAKHFVHFALTSPHVKTIRTPDAPYSLMEGMAGVVYCCAEMLEPTHSAFPGYERPIPCARVPASTSKSS
jgi:lantibiotic modifying enzyme